MSSSRTIHPAVRNHEIWPGPAGHPDAPAGLGHWTREGLLRRTAAGRLVAMWTTGGFCEPWSGNRTVIRASGDEGATWEDLGEFRHPERGLFTTELFHAGGEELHAFLNTYGNGTWMTQLQSYRAVSRDGGRTWAGPHSIPGGVQGVWPNKGIIHSSGRWIIPVSWAELIGDQWAEPSHGRAPVAGQVGLRPLVQVEVPYGAPLDLRYRRGGEWADGQHRYVCGTMVSDDQGRSFRLTGLLAGGTHGLLIEPRVVELGDGRVAMLIRSQRDGRLWSSVSGDAGASWSPAERSGIPNPAAKVLVLRGRDGRIYLVHNPVGHQGAVMGGRNPLSLWVSDDDMRSWAVKVELVHDADPAVSLNYPDGFIDEERRELVFAWEDTRQVSLLRCPLDLGR